MTLWSQAAVDLAKSVPLWMEYDTEQQTGTLHWIGDEQATNYTVNALTYDPITLTPLNTLDGTTDTYPIGVLVPGERTDFLVRKNSDGTGVISVGLEVPAVHQRGRCLVAIDDTLATPLQVEIEQLLEDLHMDGWATDTLHVARSMAVPAVKEQVSDWYDPDYPLSQTFFILGHVAVPYSGNTAYDGHNNHQGAWSADVFYGELDGNWTDQTVNNTTPAREANKNIPGDGKYDQSIIPTRVELEVGRVDFHNMPAFPDDEIELTRQYLNKSHEYKVGNKEYPRRGLVENNFGSFGEGFGQSGWRNFPTMFRGDSVSVQDYNNILENEPYLFSYACGAGSYTSASGVGTTGNLWVAKDLQTVFTMTFGSYFGDWDSQNNFLRGALGCGDILTNAWSGRPIWQLYDMALGWHIGYSAKATQNASGFIFGQGFGATSTHIALMGDPTLRLHAMKRPTDLVASFTEGNVQLGWSISPDATQGYFVYRSTDGGDWELIASNHSDSTYIDPCVTASTDYEYMVKAVRLEETGSGTYYNTSLGIRTAISVAENPFVVAFFADSDMDGFGSVQESVMGCTPPDGFVDNDLDCDDSNPNINPDATEIPNNGVDEDCDGSDLVVATYELSGTSIRLFPNPVRDYLYLEMSRPVSFEAYLVDPMGRKQAILLHDDAIDLSDYPGGHYRLLLKDKATGKHITASLIVQ